MNATLNASVPWSAIDVVLLDMDGTLLDLRFDNYFWQQLIPEKFAEVHGLSVAAAQIELEPRFAAHRGQLAWYCIDFWSRELGLPVAALKHEVREHIGWLHDAEDFLIAVRALGKRMVLVTNAHGETLRVKDTQTGLLSHFDAAVSSHSLGFPKENPQFWHRLQEIEPFDRSRTVFVDDSLPVLRAARNYGIAYIVAVTHPDSSQTPRACAEFASVARIADLIKR